MPACHATYKCGIAFDAGPPSPAFERYFHPFASMLDNLTMKQFVHNVEARINGANLHAHPDRFFIAARLAAHRAPPGRARASRSTSGTGITSMRCCSAVPSQKALEAGWRYRSCHVTHATLDAEGAIASVATQEGEPSAAICSSTAAACRPFDRQALKTPYVSFASNLFNDAAVAIRRRSGRRSLGDRVHRAQARLGLEDPAHQSLPATVRVQQPILLGG